MNKKVMCSVFGILVCLTVVAPAVMAQTTPFMIYGNILDRYDDPCNGSTVHITNLATDASWYAENSSTSNYYQQMLVEGTDFNVGETLRIRVIGPEGIQSNFVEHTVTADDVTNGGMFNIDITLMYLDQQNWYLTGIGKPTDAPPADGLTHTVDNKMQKGVKSTEDGAFELYSTEVAWFYADTGADIDLGFGEYPWEASIRAVLRSQQNTRNLTVEICRLAKDTGAVTVLASHEGQWTNETTQFSWDITCEDNPDTTQDFSTGDWLAVRLSWDCADDSLYVYYKETQHTGGTYYSYIASTHSDPGYPIPELSTLILFGLGLLMIAGYVELRRRRE